VFREIRLSLFEFLERLRMRVISKSRLWTFWELPGCNKEPARYRLSVNQFDRMVATGILTENDRVELLEGALIANWIINLVDRQIEVHSDPTGPALTEPDSAVYRRREVFGPDDAVPVVIAGRGIGRIGAADLLPKAQDPTTHGQAPSNDP